MAEHEETIRYRIIVDPAEAQREAQRAVEKERAKKSGPTDAPPGGSPTPVAGPIPSPATAAATLAAEQEKSKIRAQRMAVVGPDETVAERVSRRAKSRMASGPPSTPIDFTASRTFNVNASSSAMRGNPFRLTPNASQAFGSVITPQSPGGTPVGASLPLPPLPKSAIAKLFNAISPGLPPGLARLGSFIPGAGGGAATGLAGLGAAGTAGVGAAVALAVANAISATKRIAGGVGNMHAGAMTGNGSQILKGSIGAVGGSAQLAVGPALGMVVGKVTEKFQALVDVADKLSATFARYDARIAASEARLKVSEIQANIRNANAAAPWLTQYNDLKSHLVDIGSKISARDSQIESAVFAPFLSVGNKLLTAVDKLIDWLPFGGDKGKNKMDGVAVADRFNAWGNSVAGANARAMTGGILPNIAGAIAQRGPVDRGRSMDDARITTLKDSLGDLRRMEKNPDISDADKGKIRESIASHEKQIGKLNAAQRGRYVPGIGIPRPPAPSGLASNKPAARPDSPEQGAQSQLDNRVQAKAPAPPRAPIAQLDFQQNVNLKLEMNLMHKKEIWDSIMQIRDELVKGHRTATNEARQAMSMLNLGGITGAI